MSNEKYQPYTQANEKGSNDIRENTGANSTQAYVPNGWDQISTSIP